MDKYFLLEQAKDIVIKFEDDLWIVTERREYEEYSELLLLYLAAKKYVERFS